MMTGDEALRPRLDRLQRLCLAVGAGGLALSALGWLLSPRQFFQSYLMAYLFWFGIAVGCVGIAMLHHLVGGTWGFVIRRLLESGAMTLWLMALLFLPLVFGLKDVYLWARPEVVAADEALRHKSPYLNVNGFVIRAAVFFLIWIAFALLLNRWSAQQDRTGNPLLTERLRYLSGPGLAILFLTTSFAIIDWVMSLDPTWYSTIFGAMVVTGEALSTLSFVTAAAALLAAWPPDPAAEAELPVPFRELATPRQFQDLGNLMLAFVMLWSYMAFSQFLIIWCGNLTEEIPWYLRRTRGGWQWIGILLILFHFFLPFFALLFRETKRKARALLVVAGLILVMRLVDLFWLVAPSPMFAHPSLRVSWVDLAAPVGIGGLWLAFFLGQLKGRPLIPLHDPRLAETLERHGGEVAS